MGWHPQHQRAVNRAVILRILCGDTCHAVIGGLILRKETENNFHDLHPPAKRMAPFPVG